MTNPLFPTSLFALQPEGFDTGDQWRRKFCRSKSKIVSRSRSHVLQNIKFKKKSGLFLLLLKLFILNCLKDILNRMSKYKLTSKHNSLTSLAC